MSETPGSGYGKLRRLGMGSWSAIGIILLVLVIAAGLAALSNVVVPLVIAVILGTVLEPIVTWLTRYRIPRTLAATIVLLLACAVTTVLTIILVRGFVHQIPEISHQLARGWVQFANWMQSLDLDSSWLDQLRTAGDDLIGKLSGGALGFVTSAVYGTITLALGLFFAIYFLFFVLRDGRMFPAWLARMTGQDQALFTEIDTQVQQSLRGYFSGTAVTALITGPIFVIPLLILGIPLVIPMIILYFVLSFIPFLGAWLTGVFAILIAFGYGGPSAALIVGLGLLISNGPVQNVVSAWALGSSLKIHPVTVLVATMAGGVIAGALGMVLGPPVMSALQRSYNVVREHRAKDTQHTPTLESA
ncbi:AI-2E family transporter [Leucobacter sp. cx-328]|uniref:AI-2E family transporter n=1 Tax=unclassified Leucobacter TaxID=2621730 RepID=UPI00165D7FE1|nr:MULTISPECIES: AI-2E family transporter [unclassified Leucobacter]MBC9945080.1 AI-2E family transporter [Leucobacter sp. cx-328]